jgi:hypothetical protein
MIYKTFGRLVTLALFDLESKEPKIAFWAKSRPIFFSIENQPKTSC